MRHGPTAVLFFAASLLPLALVAGQPSHRGDYQQYEDAMRAAARMYDAHAADCRAAQPVDRAACDARVDAAWSKARALARASYINTPAEWRAATDVARESDARVTRIAGRSEQ